MEAELLAGGLNSSPSGGAARGWWGFFQLPRYTPGKDTTLMKTDGHAFWQNMVSYYTARFQWLHKVITGCYLLMILTLQMYRSHNLINYKEETASRESDSLGTKWPCMYICTCFLHGMYTPKVSVGEWSPKLGLISYLMGVGYRQLIYTQ